MITLQEKLEWYDITDVMLGDNHKKRSMAAALALAAKSKHPDAVWLTKIFNGVITEDIWAIADIFHAHKDDVRGLCFAEAIFLSGGMKTPYKKTLIKKSADRGYSFAQAYLIEFISYYGSGKEQRRWYLEESHRAGERRAHFQMGVANSRKIAKANYKIAASYGCARSMEILGQSYWKNDLDRCRWFLKSANIGNFELLCHDLEGIVRSFVSGVPGYPEIVFDYGRIFKGHDIHPNALRCTDAEIFACHKPFTHIAICYYLAVRNNARQALITWILCLKRTSGTSLINRDVRKIILQFLWRNRIAWCPTVPRTNYKMPKVDKRLTRN